jgi:hypothetical protein
MNTRRFALMLVVVACALVSVSRVAGAQEECPVSEIGYACDAGATGTCIHATCSQTADGSTSSRSCGACVTLPPNTCDDAGQPCGDGGQCSSLGGGGGGGSAGGGSSSMIVYGYAVCEYPTDAGAGDGTFRSLGTDDAAAGKGGGSTSGSDHTGTGSPSVDGGSNASPNSSTASSNSSSCALSGHGAGAFGGLALVAGAAALWLRRRTTPTA